jgi:hypothetical protein
MVVFSAMLSSVEDGSSTGRNKDVKHIRGGVV